MKIKTLLKLGAIIALIAFIVYVFSNSSALIEAFNEGYNSTRNK